MTELSLAQEQERLQAEVASAEKLENVTIDALAAGVNPAIESAQRNGSSHPLIYMEAISNAGINASSRTAKVKALDILGKIAGTRGIDGTRFGSDWAVIKSEATRHSVAIALHDLNSDTAGAAIRVLDNVLSTEPFSPKENPEETESTHTKAVAGLAVLGHMTKTEDVQTRTAIVDVCRRYISPERKTGPATVPDAIDYAAFVIGDIGTPHGAMDVKIRSAYQEARNPAPAATPTVTAEAPTIPLSTTPTTTT